MCKKRIASLLPKQIIQKSKLSKFTTFQIGGTAFVICPRTELEFVETLKILDMSRISYKVIGNGSNLLADDKVHKQVFVCTKNIDEKFKLCQTTLTTSSGANINQVIMFCKNNGLSGLENLFGIPATVGGMVVMNAGAFGTNIFECITQIVAYKNGKILKINPQDVERLNHWSELLCSGIVILSVTFLLKQKNEKQIDSKIKEVIDKRRANQPGGCSAGCVFSNPQGESAGRLIDSVGLKGFRVGGAFISEKHANFIISEKATSKEVLTLMNFVQNTVYKKYKIWLMPEIEFIGDNNEINRRLSHPQHIFKKQSRKKHYC